MTAAKYSIGVHNYQVNNADVNEYTAGELAAYLTALGMTGDAQGAFAHTKLKDLVGYWYGGLVPTGGGWVAEDPPTPAGHERVFLQEAKALNFKTMVAWVPRSPESETPPWDTVGDPWAMTDDAYSMAQFDLAAQACVDTYTDVDVWLFGNEREAEQRDAEFGIGNGEDDEANRLGWFELEARAGAIWREAGKQWAVGGDTASANTLDAIEQRMAAWTAAGVAFPDYMVFHGYGDGGVVSRQIRDVRDALEYRTGVDWSDKIIWSEWGIAFENQTSYNTKDWIRDYRSRDYAEHIGRALRRQRCYGTYFNLKEIVRPWEGITTSDSTLYPRQGIIDSLSDTAVNAEPPSQVPTTAAATTRRYLVEGRYATREWNAAWQAFKEYARSLVSYPGYWS